MGKAIKILLSILGLLIILLMGAVATLPMLIDPNNFKPQISEWVRKHTGRDLTLEGNLKFSVLPWLGVEARQVQLNNRIEFNQTQPLVRIAQLTLKIDPIPLLFKRLEIETIGLKGLVLNLEKNSHGINNWDDFAHTQAPAIQPAEKANKTNLTTAWLNPANITISHVVIEDTQIVWNDLTTQQRVTIAPLKLVIDNIRLGGAINFQMNAALKSQNPDIKETTTITAKITVNEALNHVKLDDIRLEAQTEGEIVADTQIKTTITLSSLDLDFSDNLIQLKPVLINADAQITGDSIAGHQQVINLSTSTDLDLAQQTLSLSDFKLNAGELEITGNLKGEQILGTPQFKGQLHLSSLNPKKLIKQLGLDIPETEDTQVLTRLNGQFNFNTSPDQTTLNNIAIQLDDSHLSGTALVKHFQRPAISFDLVLDQIDMDRYLKPTKKTTNESLRQPVTSILENAQMLTGEPLGNLDLHGTVNIKQFTISGMSAQNMVVKIQ